MTSGNRVEQLEQRVAELEAVAEGLTEELVETRDRLRRLEGPTEEEETDGAAELDAALAAASDHAEVVAAEATPEDVASATVEADKAEESEAGDEGEFDDIIVA